MTAFSFETPQDLQALRVQLYDVFGWQYRAKSVPPPILPLLNATGMLRSPSGLFRCNGHIIGKGYRDLSFEILEISARDTDQNLEEPFARFAGEGFSGLLVSVDHYTGFLGRTVIVRDAGMLNPKTLQDMSRVRLVDAGFEALFEVYSDDQVEGRSLMTPDFMQRLLDFDVLEVFSGLQIAFLGNRMHALLPLGEEVQFGSDRRARSAEEAKKAICKEMKLVFGLLADMDALHACARAKTEGEIQAERRKFYDARIAAVEDAVEEAIKSGAIKTADRPGYMTETGSEMVDPALWGLLRPRV